MKKILLSAAASAALFCGCADATDLGSRAIIEAAAVDYDDGYRVSALLFSSSGSSDTVNASEENVIKVVGTGKTLSEAVDSISLTDGKRIYMSETKLLILGGGFSKMSASDVFDTLYYDLRCSLNMPVCCADSAETLTDLQFTEGLTSAEKPLAMIENAYELGVSPKTTLLDLLCDSAAGRDSLLPKFSPAINGRGMTSAENGETAVLAGSRLIKNGKLGEDLNRERTIAALIERRQTSRLTLDYIYKGAERTCEAYSIKLGERNGERVVSAKFKNRGGGKLPDEERGAALNALIRLVLAE